MPFPPPSFFYTFASLSGAASVALGAFGAHGLKSRIADPAKLASWNTAAHYQRNRWISTGLTSSPSSSLTLARSTLVSLPPLTNLFQLIHSAVLLFASTTPAATSSPLSLTLLATGTTLFSGSIYLLVLDSKTWSFLGPVTPLGGSCMIG